MIDAFSMEINGNSELSFNFEKELLNQAKVMEAHRLSNLSRKEKYLEDITCKIEDSIHELRKNEIKL